MGKSKNRTDNGLQAKRPIQKEGQTQPQKQLKDYPKEQELETPDQAGNKQRIVLNEVNVVLQTHKGPVAVEIPHRHLVQAHPHKVK